jgi:hypothetical protein
MRERERERERERKKEEGKEATLVIRDCMYMIEYG